MPLIGVGFQVSLQFGFVETLKKIMKNGFADEHGKLPLPYIMLSGCLSGIPSGLVVVLIFLLRHLLIMQDFEC